MESLGSIRELRRRSPEHFIGKAENARFAASVLWLACSQNHGAHAEAVRYSGEPLTALHEAFLREATLSLELIVKGVIATKIKHGSAKASVNKIRASHNITLLWQDADLPNMDK